MSGLYYLAIAGVRNVEVRPGISTDPNPNPKSTLLLLEMAENNR